jgi:2-oxoglutarate dehydrogenase complex dehydrogenase (E1) component-like enzyme
VWVFLCVVLVLAFFVIAVFTGSNVVVTVSVVVIVVVIVVLLLVLLLLNHSEFRKPLILATPKDLLRHRLAVSDMDEFTPGTSFKRMYSERFPVRARACACVGVCVCLCVCV